MPDNTTLNSGTGGDTIATDDIGGVKFPRSKLVIGADGANDGDVSAANPLPALLRSEQVDDAAFTPATSRVVMVGATLDNTSPDSVDEGDGGALRMSANRALHVVIRDNAGNERGLAIDASGNLAVTQSGTWSVNAVGAVAHDAADSGNPLKIGGYASATAPAAVSADGDRVNAWFDLAGRLQIGDGGGSLTVDNGGTFAVQDSEKIADDAAFTVGTSKVLPAGFLADESSPDSVDEGDVGAARMTLDRRLITVSEPKSSGTGLDVFRSIDVDESEEEVKGSAGMLYGYYFANLHATSARYLKFYNDTAANVTVGTTTPFLTLPLPATAAGHVNFPVPVKFDTGICVVATTGLADNDTGAPGANEIVLNVYYK